MRVGGPVRVAIVAGVLLSACAGSASSDAVPTTETSAPAGTSSAVTSSSATPPSTAAPVTSVSPPPTLAPSTAPASTDVVRPERDLSAVRPVLEAFVESEQLDGAGLVIVDREDGIVHEEYVGDFAADRVSLIASSSKMITAGVLLHLADRGLLDLDAPVADAVGWGAGNPEITPAQLVSNSSGLVGLFPNTAYGPYVCQFLADRELEECGAEVFESPDDDADVIAPDSEFRYGGAQWQVAGAVAEAVSGSSWAELIDEIYIQPCGVTSLGYNNHWLAAGGFGYPADFDPADLAPTENPQMEGGAYITPPDYAKLLLMHLRGGVCDGGRVLSEESVARAHADRTAEAYVDGGAPGYGMGWWVDRESGIISDGGAYGSLPWLDVEDGYGAYLVIEADSDLGSRIFRELEPLVESAMTR